MSETLYSSPRRFALWLYAVGHRTLLLRSVKSAESRTRVDVVFKPVSHLNLPASLDGLVVRMLDDVERGTVAGTARLSLEPSDRIYAVSGQGFEGWVVSETMGWHEDEGEYNDPSDHFSLPTLSW